MALLGVTLLGAPAIAGDREFRVEQLEYEARLQRVENDAAAHHQALDVADRLHAANAARDEALRRRLEQGSGSVAAPAAAAPVVSVMPSPASRGEPVDIDQLYASARRAADSRDRLAAEDLMRNWPWAPTAAGTNPGGETRGSRSPSR